MAASTMSAKGVAFVHDQVVLAQNHRGEWELPGGQPGPDEPLPVTVAREFTEETGLDVSVSDWLLTEPFEVVAGRWVTIEAYRCVVREPFDVQPSHEHRDVRLFPIDALPDALPAVYRRAIALAAGDDHPAAPSG